MIRLQAFKFELRPTGEQMRLMRRFVGSCRFVFNKALSLQKARFEQGNKKLSYAGLCKALTAWKEETETTWLCEMPSQALQQSLRDLERAYVNLFINRAAFPKFKKKGEADSFRYPQGMKLDQNNCRIFLPKLGWLRYRSSREVFGTVKNVTVSLQCGKWFVSIQTEQEVEQAIHPARSAVGLDLGIVQFATLSTGEIYRPVNSFKKHQAKLARLQRQLKHKTKFSKNWQKLQAKIRKVHHHIANIRRDFLHKTSTEISKNHAMIAIEDLSIKNMSQSAKGTIDAPGRKVKQKTGLNRVILDQGWGEFRRHLEYKQLWRGGWLVAVPPHYTSQKCSACGYAHANNRKTQADFICQACGHTENADINAAKNILAAGLAVMACEASGEAMPPAAGTHREAA